MRDSLRAVSLSWLIVLVPILAGSSAGADENGRIPSNTGPCNHPNCAAARASNKAPIAKKDAPITAVDTSVTINVTANDRDRDGRIVRKTVRIVGAGPRHGRAGKERNGMVTYTPDPGFSGQDTFRYRVKDNRGALSNRARVQVTVAPGPDLWEGDAEEGNLNDLWMPEPEGVEGNNGGGEYNSGSPASADSTVTHETVHGGSHGVKQYLDSTSGTSNATRLFRWREHQSTSAGLYYTTWNYLPQGIKQVDGNGWWMMEGWKRQDSSGEVVNMIHLGLDYTYDATQMYLMLEFFPVNGAATQRYTQRIKTLPAGRWFKMQTYVQPSSSGTGQIQVWCDGIEIFNRTGLNIATPQWEITNMGYNLSPNAITKYVDDAMISTVSTVSAVSSPGTNLVDESGFETGSVSPWYGWNNGEILTILSAGAHSGTKALQISTRNQPCATAAQNLSGFACARPGTSKRGSSHPAGHIGITRVSISMARPIKGRGLLSVLPMVGSWPTQIS